MKKWGFMQRGKQQKQLKKSKGQRTEMGCEGKQKKGKF